MTDSDRFAVPSFLTPHDQVPAALRDVLVEADGCLQNGFLTGGTACSRRAIEMMLTSARVDGDTFEQRVKSLHDKHGVPQMLTSILVQCGTAIGRDGTKLSGKVLELFLATMKAVAHELYVLGPERSQRLQYIRNLVGPVSQQATPQDVDVPAEVGAAT